MTAGCASALSQRPESSTGHGVNATTGSVLHMMAASVLVMASVTVVSVSVMRSGMERPASCSKTAPSPAGEARSSAETLREWSAPMQALVSVAAACAKTQTAGVW